MKKNRFIKIAAVVFTLCLITTCGISTTLAKYTTGGNAQDSARVAKWGVQLTMEGDPLFHNEYKGTDDAITVSANTKVVAPGTSSEKAESSSRFAISGKPEVAVRIEIDFDWTSDVFLGAGTYQDPTKAAIQSESDIATLTKYSDGLYYEQFEVTTDYYPVVFTLKQVKDANGDTAVEIAKGNLEDIKVAINDWAKNYAPNTDLTAEFELSWEWVYGNPDVLVVELADKADTYLGNLAAEINPDNEATNFSTTLAYEIAIRVVQID